MPQRKICILDGGMSRELIRLNAPFRQPEWSALALLEAPHIVKQVHLEFAAAGADILTTNSYALVPYHIGEERFRDRGEELVALSGLLARKAAEEAFTASGKRVLVAGCLPPIFGSYEPNMFDASKVQDYLSVFVRALAPYVDFWLGETFSLIAEGQAVKTAVQNSGKPFWISFTPDDTRYETVSETEQTTAWLRSGERVSEAARWVLDANAEALLFNCSRPEVMSTAVREANAVFVESGRTIQIGVYANAFEPAPVAQTANSTMNETRKDLTAEPYLAFARDWVDQGVTIVGGCCGIGCDHIKRLAEQFASQSQ